MRLYAFNAIAFIATGLFGHGFDLALFHSTLFAATNNVEISVVFSVFCCFWWLQALAMTLSTPFMIVSIFHANDFIQENSLKFDSLFSGTKYQPLIAFSIYTNGKKLFACPPPSPSTIQCLEGLRVLSIMWIVYNHVYRRYGYTALREPTTFDKVKIC